MTLGEKNMPTPTNEEIESYLVGVMSDGFNRSLNALVEAGALDPAKLKKHYKGVGSRFYDLVTAQLELTAKYGAPGVRKLFSPDGPQSKEA